MAILLKDIEIIITDDKILDYLLKPRAFEDKSKFLKLGDYSETNWEVLKSDLLKFARENEYFITDSNEYGTFIQISGSLVGPNGYNLKINTVWLNKLSTKIYRFITLFPLKKQKNETSIV